MWRPKDWENPTSNLIDDIAYDAYEDGADAILEAIKPLIKQIAPFSKLIDILYEENGCPTNESSWAFPKL